MIRSIVVALLVAGLATASVDAQPKKEPLVERVRVAIERGIRFLKENQRADGSWEINIPSAGYQGGWTALSVLALLNSGVPVSDDHVARGLSYLRKLEPSMTYVRALQTMVFVEAGQPEDRERIQKNVKWLIDARVFRDGKFSGWGYGRTGTSSDNSNTQYAMLGLWAGRQAGVDINREIWEAIRDYYVRTQDLDGGWKYSTSKSGGPELASMTMTTAGVCGLLIAGMELNVGREKMQADGSALNCGAYDESPAVRKGLSWISRGFTIEVSQRIFYHVYGLERTGRLSGQRFIGNHDWYREGCLYLVENQLTNGSWRAQGNFDQWPVVSTSFALLFLSKGRTPVLISKLVHGELQGPWQRDEGDTDWNNDRNDLRHLVDFTTKTLFEKLPLAWQHFDILKAVAPRKGGAPNEEGEEEATAELLQSPIAYFNGHRSPLQRFTAIEKKILQRYVDNGGFLLAEACCNSPQFDRGFKTLVAELWPDNELTELDGDHPVWRSFYTVPPGKPFKLYGLSSGCKTVLIYSPQDLSCHWEGNNTKDGNSVLAFKLGVNIIAYATGREPPRPRLTQVQVVRDQGDPPSLPRGFLQVAQLKHTGDWQPAPKAMRNLLDHLRGFAGLDVSLKTQAMYPGKNIVDYKFVYMHGRRGFKYDAEDLDDLRFNLETGGLLLADACCGKEAFDKSFRIFAQQLFPKEKLVRVPEDDELFSKALNGLALTRDNIKCRTEPGGPMRTMPPYLEGIKLNGRWVVLYSKYDLGCALEKHQSSDCVGYHPESALRVAGAAVLYTFSLRK